MCRRVSQPTDRALAGVRRNAGNPGDNDPRRHQRRHRTSAGRRFGSSAPASITQSRRLFPVRRRTPSRRSHLGSRQSSTVAPTRADATQACRGGASAGPRRHSGPGRAARRFDRTGSRSGVAPCASDSSHSNPIGKSRETKLQWKQSRRSASRQDRSIPTSISRAK